MSMSNQCLSGTKWLEKDVRKIVFRNLAMTCSKEELQVEHVRNSPDFRLEIFSVTSESERYTIFNGNIIRNCSNPSWAIAGVLHLTDPLLANSRELMLQITEDGVGLDRDEDCRTLQFVIHLSDLVSLGSVLLVNIDSFPINSVLFSTDSGYYVTTCLFNDLTKFGLTIAHNRVVLDDESEAAALEVHSMCEKMSASMLIIDQLREEATRSLNVGNLHGKRVHMVSRKNALEQLRLEVLAAELEASESLAAEALMRDRLLDTSQLSSAVGLCVQYTKDISLLRNENVQKEEKLVKLLFMLESRQCKVLHGLRRIYPILHLESGDYSIRGSELPADPYSLNTQRDDEQISTALGYAVHVLILVSKYLNLSLRYHLVYSSSRSSIGDATAQYQGLSPASVMLPLYKKGVERARFDRALVWLGRDIQQILTCMGLEYEARKNALYNINKIFLCYASNEKIAM